MAVVVQASQTNSAFPLILQGEGAILESEVILANASRGTADLKQYTLMSQIAATMKWVPWLLANVGATDGSQYPMGIYVGDTVPAASIIAGDVTSCPILIGGAFCMVDANLIVFDKGNSGGGTAAAFSTVITTPTNLAMIAERFMNIMGLYPTGSLAGDITEN